MQAGMLGRSRGVALGRTRNDATQLSDSTRRGGRSRLVGRRPRQGAEDAAALWCDVLGKTNDCQMLTSGLGCLSIAVSSDGKTFAGGVALFQDAADAAALDGAPPGSKIDLRDCNGSLPGPRRK